MTLPSASVWQVGWTEVAADSMSEFSRSLWVIDLVVEGCVVLVHQFEERLRILQLVFRFGHRRGLSRGWQQQWTQGLRVAHSPWQP